MLPNAVAIRPSLQTTPHTLPCMQQRLGDAKTIQKINLMEN
jgi:hypothetical protein